MMSNPGLIFGQELVLIRRGIKIDNRIWTGIKLGQFATLNPTAYSRRQFSVELTKILIWSMTSIAFSASSSFSYWTKAYRRETPDASTATLTQVRHEISLIFRHFCLPLQERAFYPYTNLVGNGIKMWFRSNKTEDSLSQFFLREILKRENFVIIQPCRWWFGQRRGSSLRAA